MPEVKPFKTDCRSCGAPMWMCPLMRKDGRVGWAPMNVDEDAPNTPPEEFVREMSHHITCPDADKWRKSRGKEK
ncbi:hypothetical protein KKE60_05420 [Patescibacteria group bacterium]|nr:hypothetical protein [Patescibacteria group bacterium]